MTTNGDAVMVMMYASILLHSILLRSTFQMRLKDHSTRDISQITIHRNTREDIIP